ncbi:MAG: GPR endopeptidase [Oscillospiraceae bacterium]
MPFYTDIAAELYPKRCKNVPSGVKLYTSNEDNIAVTRVDILKNGLRRAKGTYITLDLPCLLYAPIDKNSSAVQAVASRLRALLPTFGTVLVAGIGNRGVTADALGTATADKIFATRGLKQGEVPLRGVAVLCPGVVGATGISTAELLQCAVGRIKPSAVLCIDSLCTKEAKHLCRSVQISSAGLAPRTSAPLNEKLLGVPTFAIGVPMVMELEQDKNEVFLVTPKDVDALLQRAAEMLALAINKALQPALSVGELHYLTS